MGDAGEAPRLIVVDPSCGPHRWVRSAAALGRTGRTRGAGRTLRHRLGAAPDTALQRTDPRVRARERERSWPMHSGLPAWPTASR
ncbi:MAG: hypothetical protein LBE67_09355 [Kocuria palustris]|nr:hypothetical protein [Kocuria palustris]